VSIQTLWASCLELIAYKRDFKMNLPYLLFSIDFVLYLLNKIDHKYYCLLKYTHI